MAQNAPPVAGIVVETNPSKERLDSLKVKTWGIWTKEPSTFDWFYDEQEVCYFLAGDVTIRTPQGDVHIEKGNLVTFPQGLKCTWVVKGAVRKHYKFG
jgi:uncharacterized cupin superfamily protein